MAWLGTQHRLLLLPQDPHPSTINYLPYSEVEERLELGEISENNNNKESNNNNDNNKSADYNTAYDALIVDGHSEEDAKDMCWRRRWRKRKRARFYQSFSRLRNGKGN